MPDYDLQDEDTPTRQHYLTDWWLRHRADTGEIPCPLTKRILKLSWHSWHHPQYIFRLIFSGLDFFFGNQCWKNSLYQSKTYFSCVSNYPTFWFFQLLQSLHTLEHIYFHLFKLSPGPVVPGRHHNPFRSFLDLIPWNLEGKAMNLQQ